MSSFPVLFSFFMAIDAMFALPIGAYLGFLFGYAIFKRESVTGHIFLLVANVFFTICVKELLGNGTPRELYSLALMGIHLYNTRYFGAAIFGTLLLVNQLLDDNYGKIRMYGLVVVTMLYSPLFFLGLPVTICRIAISMVWRFCLFLYGIMKPSCLFIDNTIKATCFSIYDTVKAAIWSVSKRYARFLTDVTKRFNPSNVLLSLSGTTANTNIDANFQAELPRTPKLSISSIVVVADIAPSAPPSPPILQGAEKVTAEDNPFNPAAPITAPITSPVNAELIKPRNIKPRHTSLRYKLGEGKSITGTLPVKKFTLVVPDKTSKRCSRSPDLSRTPSPIRRRRDLLASQVSVSSPFNESGFFHGAFRVPKPEPEAPQTPEPKTVAEPAPIPKPIVDRVRVFEPVPIPEPQPVSRLEHPVAEDKAVEKSPTPLVTFTPEPKHITTPDDIVEESPAPLVTFTPVREHVTASDNVFETSFPRLNTFVPEPKHTPEDSFPDHVARLETAPESEPVSEPAPSPEPEPVLISENVVELSPSTAIPQPPGCEPADKVSQELAYVPDATYIPLSTPRFSPEYIAAPMLHCVHQSPFFPPSTSFFPERELDTTSVPGSGPEFILKTEHAPEQLPSRAPAPAFESELSLTPASASVFEHLPVQAFEGEFAPAPEPGPVPEPMVIEEPIPKPSFVPPASFPGPDHAILPGFSFATPPYITPALDPEPAHAFESTPMQEDTYELVPAFELVRPSRELASAPVPIPTQEMLSEALPVPDPATQFALFPMSEIAPEMMSIDEPEATYAPEPAVATAEPDMMDDVNADEEDPELAMLEAQLDLELQEEEEQKKLAEADSNQDVVMLEVAQIGKDAEMEGAAIPQPPAQAPAAEPQGSQKEMDGPSNQDVEMGAPFTSAPSATLVLPSPTPSTPALFSPARSTSSLAASGIRRILTPVRSSSPFSISPSGLAKTPNSTIKSTKISGIPDSFILSSKPRQGCNIRFDPPKPKAPVLEVSDFLRKRKDKDEENRKKLEKEIHREMARDVWLDELGYEHKDVGGSRIPDIDFDFRVRRLVDLMDKSGTAARIRWEDHQASIVAEVERLTIVQREKRREWEMNRRKKQQEALNKRIEKEQMNIYGYSA
ncbi:hypothetical protein AAE478_001382 [Parahypoxylon ruwenzoriense]